MRRIGLCCAVSFLMFVGVAHASPIGQHRSTSSVSGHAILLGGRTIQRTVGQVSAGQAEAFPFAVRRAGTVSAVGVYVDAHNQAKALVVALYASRSGHPVRRLASGTLTAPKAGSWNTVSVTGAAVRSRSRYWVAVLGRGGNLYFRDAHKSSCEAHTSNTRLASLPRLWTSSTRLTACSISAYATGQATSSTSGPPLTFGTFAPANPAQPSSSSPATTNSGTPAAPAAPNSTPPALPTLPPVNTGAPTVTGNPIAGNTLTTSTGSWIDSPTSYGYQWQNCDSLGLTCTNISGATSSGYTLQASDIGSTIRSVVTATNSGGSTPAGSATTATVTAPAAPTVSAAPVVSGQAVQGQTLSTSSGSWNGSPTSYAYRWQDCNSSGASCVNISGATSSSYTLKAGDVGSTIRSVVTATNAGGSTSASSAATTAVTAPPPAAPTNTAAPAVSGQAVQGQTLSTSNGSWNGSPTSYAYKWQDCNSSGASCTNISGATSSSYTLQAGDVGATIRSVVTATNAGGSGSASSAPTGTVSSSGGGGGGSGSTQVGAPTPAGVTCTQTLNPGANVQSAVSAASPGAVVCLNAGSWSAFTLNGIAPASPGVTVAATPGQTVSVPGFTISGTSQNLTVEGFNITSGAGNGRGNGIDLLCQINGGVTLTHNTIENISGGDAIHAYSGSCGGSGTQTGVSITYNQLDHASTFVEVQGNSCACASADVNWTISHNVMGPAENYGGAGHYIQGQWLGATIDNNAFEGPTVFNSNAHNNVLHCYTTNAPGCQNITFDNNIIWHAQSRAQTILITDNNLTGIHIDNNLDIDDPACGTSIDCPASPWFVEKGYNFTLIHNTSVGAVWSVNMGTCGDGCVSNPNTWDAEYNIAVGTPQSGQNNFGAWECQTSCTTAHNTSQDNSANSDWGGTGDVINWTPAWQSTSWTPVSGPGYQAPPAGYYQPTGLSISGAGYQGQIGP